MTDHLTGATRTFQSGQLKLCFWERLKQQLGQVLNIDWANAIWSLMLSL